MNLIPIYIIALLALSGLGITFANAESLLALCFFIFLALIINNSEPIGESLAQSRQAVQAELLSCMIDGEKVGFTTKRLNIFHQTQLLAGLKTMR